MIVSVKDLCEMFKISHSKIYVIIGRSEFARFYIQKKGRTRYFELNEESNTDTVIQHYQRYYAAQSLTNTAI